MDSGSREVLERNGLRRDRVERLLSETQGVILLEELLEDWHGDRLV